MMTMTMTSLDRVQADKVLLQDDNDDNDGDDLDDDDNNDDDNDDTSLDRAYANKVVEDTPGLGISGSNPSLAP